jgi:phosphoribosylpyrophosphate synthetase
MHRAPSSAPSLVFALPEYRGMQQQLCAAGHEAGELQIEAFPDGERYMRIASATSTAATSCSSAARSPTPPPS